MKAAVVPEFGKPLVIEDRPIPEPGFVGTRADLNDVFALHALGRTRVIYETRPLDSVNTAIDEVLRGKARARLVFAP